MDIKKEVEDLLKLDLSEGGITQRNPDMVALITKQCGILKEYFEGTGVNVKLILNTGFNSLGFIRISGKSIHVLDKDILWVMQNKSAYVNIMIEDDDKVVFELAYTDLCKTN